ncbi:MAG: hypothetical protein HY361_00640 [Candidatus Aenigmarchaeota archaeon]|nr:hypothetical protein [Candidatus Aenigmarchaeota archaeon]
MPNMHEETAIEFLGDQYQKCWNFVKGFNSGLVVGILSVILILLSFVIPLGILALIAFSINYWLGWAIWLSSLSAIGIVIVIIALYLFGYLVKNR